MQKSSFRRTPLATGVALALGATVMSPAVAQEDAIEEIVAVGIRGSLQSSMIQKRDAQGVSDGIIAEDIGKFPDTNLAESMQRITGVSIDRTEIGEGSRVTVRGVGPDFNLVTLNGRQMPGTTIENTTSNSSRSFDFANLASEAVSAINVYKTSMARLPTGGMGATVDIRTARPLDNADRVASLGVKYVMDSSVENGDSGTPEISGIFSNTSADGKFGVAVSASYQERNLGYNQAAHSSGWRTNFGEACCGWGNLPAEGANGTTTENRPTGLYMTPQNILYTFNDVQRERVNGQLVLQFAPTDTLTATLDYTYAENEIMSQDAELSAWNGFSPTILSSFTDGPVAVPTSFTSVRDLDNYPNSIPANGDYGGNASNYGVNHELSSVGFNLAWDPSDSLGFELDFHDSKSESGSAGKWGSHNDVGWFSFNRGSTTFIEQGDFPGLAVDFAPGTTVDPALVQTTGSSFRDADSINEVQQLRLSGSYFFDNDAYSLDFGVMLTDVDNRSTYAKVEVPSWGGSGESPDDYDDALFELDNFRPYFSGVPGAGNSEGVTEFYRLVNFDAAIAAASQVLPGGRWGPPTGLDDPNAADVTDKRTNEQTTAAYIQFNASFEMGDMPANLAAGLRYEKTDVVSQALVPVYNAILWNSTNEYSLTDQGKDFTKLKGDYDYVLPSVDFNIELVEDVILRASYSETLGRANWNDIQGGQTLATVRLSGGTGNQGDPGLLPLESANIDLSVEWYYGPGSYVSVAYFDKAITNYISTTTISGTPFNLPHPAQGSRFAEAEAAVGGADLNAIRQYIFENYADTPEVTITGTNSLGEFLGSIAGVAGDDQTAVFDITVPTNAGKSGVDGWELAVQHFFGDSGFGVSANYTIVNADDEFNNVLVNESGGVVQQFVLEGISDSANLVAFYEDEKWSARLAYNWRDEYLTSTTVDNQPNPEYVEEYGQWDANVSYNINDQLTVVVEGINLTDEYTRSYVRTPGATGYLTTLGARYMIGARYDFE
jgi:TonB-dependent receptor